MDSDAIVTIGRYEVQRVLGQGGFGEVYLAYDPMYKRNVALKKMRTDIPVTDRRRSLFLNEARLVSELSHSSIIPIYSIEEAEGVPYYTMPYIEGITLKEWIADKWDTPSEYSAERVAHTFLQICQAVAYAHSKGLLHRDLKPSNIMIGSSGELVILDWGLVKLQDSEKSDTLEGSMAYLAPELIYGNPPNCQSEIYSLGMILYQMLTNRLPFHRDSIEEYHRLVDKEVLIDPQSVVPDRFIPPALSKIVHKCLAQSLRKRYRSVNQLIADLLRFLDKPSTEKHSTRRVAGHKKSPHLDLSWLQKELLCRLGGWQVMPRKSAAYLFFLATRYLKPEEIGDKERVEIRSFLESSGLFFFFKGEALWEWRAEFQQRAMAIQLAFWLARSDLLEEMIDDLLQMDPPRLPLVENALLAIMELEPYTHQEIILQKLEELSTGFLDVQAVARFAFMRFACTKKATQALFTQLPLNLEEYNLQPLWHILERSLQRGRGLLVHKWVALLRGHTLSAEQQMQLDCYQIWAWLLQNELDKAASLLKRYPFRRHTLQEHPLHFLYGCWIAAKRGKAKALTYFSRFQKLKLSTTWESFLLLILEDTRLDSYLKESFMWERRRIFRRAILFYHCTGEHKKTLALKKLERTQYTHAFSR
ncbi:MAG: protein kinase [Verrucomicrobia bacterium]|nr:protein kinase [Verrucomicrobiota bacterium]